MIEYLFPLALVGFSIIGWIAFAAIGRFPGRVLTIGGVFDVTAHNSFSQLLPAFALSMVAVGLAAVVYALFAAFTAFNSMLHYGTAKEPSPTLMIVIPIVTVLGIMFLRQDHALHVQYDMHKTAGESMVMLARMLTVQLVFLGLGLVVLKRNGYFKDFVFGSKLSPGSYGERWFAPVWRCR